MSRIDWTPPFFFIKQQQQQKKKKNQLLFYASFLVRWRIHNKSCFVNNLFVVWFFIPSLDSSMHPLANDRSWNSWPRVMGTSLWEMSGSLFSTSYPSSLAWQPLHAHMAQLDRLFQTHSNSKWVLSISKTDWIVDID